MYTNIYVQCMYVSTYSTYTCVCIYIYISYIYIHTYTYTIIHSNSPNFCEKMMEIPSHPLQRTTPLRGPEAVLPPRG